MRSRLVRSAVLGVAIVLVNVSPAGAGVGDTATTPSPTTAAESRAVSDSLAGYKYTPEGDLLSMSVRSIRVPTIDCAASKDIDRGVSLGIRGDRDFPAGASLSMYCNGPDPVYQLWASVCQWADKFDDIQPGERVRMSITQPVQFGDATATVTVLSRPDRPSISVTESFAACRAGDTPETMSGGAFPFRDGQGLLPFPDFADTRLNGVEVNGSCLNEDARRIRLVNDYGTMTPSRLRNCGFTVRADPAAPDTLTRPGDARLAPTASSDELADLHVDDWAGSASNARSIVH